MSDQHAWIADVMLDLSKYAQLNHLHETKKQIERAVFAFDAEIERGVQLIQSPRVAGNVIKFNPDHASCRVVK